VLSGLYVQRGCDDRDEQHEHLPGRETMRRTPAMHVAHRSRAAVSAP
jgi:hypothetical protein